MLVGKALLDKAKIFAKALHFEQKYGIFPYIKHLRDVENVLIRFGYIDDYRYRAAAWLHDTIEDNQNATLEVVRSEFGDLMAAWVFAVTDGEGNNRKERKAIVIKKLFKLPDAIVIKLADRIGNFESSILSNSSKLNMYIKEMDSFKVLKNRIISDQREIDMWLHLEYLESISMFASEMHKRFKEQAV